MAKRFGLLLILILAGLFITSSSFSQSSSVLINEFIPDPIDSDAAPKPQGEWVELYNSTSGSINVDGWVLKDKYNTHILVISSSNTNTSDTTVKGGGYLVVYRDGDGDFSLNQDGDQVRLFDSSSNLVDSVSYSGSSEEGKSWSLIGSEWVRGTDPTPGAKNVSSAPKEEPGDQQQENQPVVNFSSPTPVSADTSFSVTVTLKNFKSGTYSLKVLIGRGDKFYDGRTKGVGGDWLAWNASWDDFPKLKIGSSGLGSKKIQAKTDSDVTVGSYRIKVRAHKDNDNVDSKAKSLAVTGLAAEEGESKVDDHEGGGGSSTLDVSGEEIVGGGEVLGGEVAGDKSPKLNFYTFLGIFGMLVGGGGLILAFRKGVRRSQTPDTPQQESDLL